MTFLINVNFPCLTGCPSTPAHCQQCMGDVVVGVSRKVKMKSSYTASDWVNRLKLCNGERERDQKNLIFYIGL